MSLNRAPREKAGPRTQTRRKLSHHAALRTGEVDQEADHKVAGRETALPQAGSLSPQESQRPVQEEVEDQSQRKSSAWNYRMSNDFNGHSGKPATKPSTR